MTSELLDLAVFEYGKYLERIGTTERGRYLSLAARTAEVLRRGEMSESFAGLADKELAEEIFREEDSGQNTSAQNTMNRRLRFIRFLRTKGFFQAPRVPSPFPNCQNLPEEKSLQSLFEGFLLREKIKGKSPITLGIYFREFRKFSRYLGKVGAEKFSSIGAEVFEGYKDELKAFRHNGKPLDEEVRRRKILFVKFFFRELYASGETLTNPAARLRVPRKGKRESRNFLNEDEMERFLEDFPYDTALNIRDKVMTSLTYGYGLRLGETIRLKIADIDFGNGHLYIRQTKGARDRCLPLISPVETMLKEYLEKVRPRLLKQRMKKVRWKAEVILDFEEVFPSISSKSGRISDHWVGLSFARRIKVFLEKEGIKKRLSFHCLRYSFATNMLRRGLGIRYIQKILGHKDLDSTGRYARVLAEDMKRAVREFHPREAEESLGKCKIEAAKVPVF